MAHLSHHLAAVELAPLWSARTLLPLFGAPWACSLERRRVVCGAAVVQKRFAHKELPRLPLDKVARPVEAATFSVHRELLARHGAFLVERTVKRAVAASPTLREWTVRVVRGGEGRNFDLFPPRGWTVEQRAEIESSDVEAAVRALRTDLDRGSDLVKGVEVHEWMSAEGDISMLSGGSGGGGLPEARDKSWALNLLDVPRVWNGLGARGQGVLVGHPDSGFIPHDEMNLARVRTDIDFDFVEHDDDPSTTASDHHCASHGLATASVIMSSTKGEMKGTAPECDIMPLRVTYPGIGFGDFRFPAPVLFTPGVARLRDAINHCVDKGAHVISISLGTRSRSRSLHKAIQRAVNAGVIVVAAAGNYSLAFDIWPAAFPEVVSCGAVNARSGRWKPSAFGDHVDVAAPGEDVWRATFGTDTQGKLVQIVEPSSGTSYAAAHVAGIAALWYSHHGGRKALLEKVDGKGAVLVKTFQRDLVNSCEALPGLGLGAGLVDAFKTCQPQFDPVAAEDPWPCARVHQ